MSDQARCLSCGRWRPLGALVRVVPVDPLHAEFLVCRHSLEADCLTIAGPRSQSLLALVDVDQAMQFDRDQAALTTRGPS